MKKQNFVQAIRKRKCRCWTIPENDIWNLPEGDELRFDLTGLADWGIISKCRGIAVSADFGDFSRMYNLRIYGPRNLQNPREDGYQLEGRVSIGGKYHSAFTSSQLFEREDGSLIDVGVLFVRMP